MGHQLLDQGLMFINKWRFEIISLSGSLSEGDDSQIGGLTVSMAGQLVEYWVFWVFFKGYRFIFFSEITLRVKECDDVYALGDYAPVDQRKIMDDISAIFKVADKDNSGTLTKEEFKDVIEDIIIRYPQVELYLQKKHLSDVYDLQKDEDENNKEWVDIEGFKLALSHIDKQMKSLPATAQVAAEQGAYLARCFNMREKCTFEPEGPQKCRSGGHHEFLPFQ
ncbi:hypothetical protein ACS0TY_008458 [Phlomoides rotata]